MISIEDAWAIVEHDPKFNTEGFVLSKALDFRDEGQRQLILAASDGLASHRVTLWPSDGGEVICSRWNQVGSANRNELQRRIRFEIVALAVCEAYEQHNSEEIRRKREEQEAEIVRRREAAEARKEKLKDREEKLLHEHVGDQVRVRMYGEQSIHGAYIRALPTVNGEDYEVHVEWMKSSNYGKPFSLERAMLLDVMIGSRYCELWNDGFDDLLPYEAEKIIKKRKSVKPCK